MCIRDRIETVCRIESRGDLLEKLGRFDEASGVAALKLRVEGLIRAPGSYVVRLDVPCDR